MLLLPLLAAVLAAAPAEKPSLLVLDLTAAGGVTPEVARVLGEAITTELSARSPFHVLSQADVSTLLGLERQKQMLGCGDESSSCLAELAGALGARFVMTGSVARLGEAWQLNLQTLDTLKAQPLGRATRIARDLAALRALLPWALADATATPPPEPPSVLPSLALFAGGGVALVAGGFLGLQAFTQETAVRRELDLGAQGQALLKPASFYSEQAGTVRTLKLSALGAAVAGALLLGGGLLALPQGPAPAPALALSASPRGVGLVGVWP